MGEEREGPDATPQTQDEPYPEAPAAARRWTKHLARRDTHPRNRQIVTPRGVYRSASQAADAYGYSRSHASWLARHELRGWRWFVHGIDEGKPRTVRGGKSPHRPPPPKARRVHTPEAVYDSATLAAEAHGITRQAAARRARTNAGGWSYDPLTPS